ncbi:cytochrome P450 [Hyaloraphidium curvatum]|nr:cytochrome P450 [Hyaloraphidium curvatum]
MGPLAAAALLALALYLYFWLLPLLRSDFPAVSGAWNPFARVSEQLGKRRFAKLCREHARKGGVLRVAPGTLSVADPALVARIAKTLDLPKPAMIYSNLVPPTFRERSVLDTLEDAPHRMQRKLLSHSFSVRYLSNLEPQMLAVWHDLRRALDGEMASSPDRSARVDLVAIMQAFAADVIGLTAFGRSLGSIGGRHPFVEEMNRSMKWTALFVIFPFLRKRYQWFPVKRTFEYQREFTESLVEAREREMASRPDDVPADILKSLISAQDEESKYKLSREQVMSNALVFMGAGSDTTAHTMTWALFALTQHRSFLERLRAELDPLAGAGGTIPLAELKGARNLSNLINETLRMYPVAGAGLLAREVPPEGFAIEHGGRTVEVPPGTWIEIAMYALLRSPALWNRADEFWPDRWDAGDGKEGDGPLDCNRAAFAPFMQGSRDCIGKNFAVQEMRVLLAHFVTRYEFELLCDPREVVPEDNLVLTVKGCSSPMRVWRRGAAGRV